MNSLWRGPRTDCLCIDHVRTHFGCVRLRIHTSVMYVLTTSKPMLTLTRVDSVDHLMHHFRITMYRQIRQIFTAHGWFIGSLGGEGKTETALVPSVAVRDIITHVNLLPSCLLQSLSLFKQFHARESNLNLSSISTEIYVLCLLHILS